MINNLCKKSFYHSWFLLLNKQYSTIFQKLNIFFSDLMRLSIYNKHAYFQRKFTEPTALIGHTSYLDDKHSHSQHNLHDLHSPKSIDLIKMELWILCIYRTKVLKFWIIQIQINICFCVETFQITTYISTYINRKSML